MLDGHCHLDRARGNCREAVAALHREAVAAGVDGMILLNIPEIEFPNDDALNEAALFGGFFRVFPALDPQRKASSEEIPRLRAMGARGVKLHPRFHGYRVDGAPVVDLVRAAADAGLPVLADAFPDAHNLLAGNDAAAFARLAEAVPKAKIAAGHACGHHILDLLMMAKTFKNLYLDLSFSWLYYRDASFASDAVYAAASLKGERAFWGTDHPDRAYAQSVQLSRELADRVFGDEGLKERVFARNALVFLGEANE